MPEGDAKLSTCFRLSVCREGVGKQEKDTKHLIFLFPEWNAQNALLEALLKIKRFQNI